MAIHAANGGYCISSHRVWMPGHYESEAAAKYAFRFTDDQLSRLQKAANDRAGQEGGTITMQDLKEERKRNPKPVFA